MSWKSAAVPRAPSRLAGRRSSRPIASDTRRTRCEWPAVYGSRASTAAFSVSIVSRRLASSACDDSARSCELDSRSSCWACMRDDAPRTSSASTSQRIPKTRPTAYQTVLRVSSMISSTVGVVESDLGCADDSSRRGVQWRPDLHDRRAVAHRVDERRRRRSRLERLAQVRARATTADTVGPRRRERQPAVARVDVHAAHVARKPHRAGESPPRAAGPWRCLPERESAGASTASPYAATSSAVSSSAAPRRSRVRVDESATAPRARMSADASRKARSSVRERPRPDERCCRTRRIQAVSARTSSSLSVRP